MIASLHVADVGARRAPGVLVKPPKPAAVAGLRHANVGLTAPLSRRVRPSPSLGRVGLVAFWDDDDALDRFLADDPLAAKLAGGWHVRLEPLRAFGSWPGLDDGIPAARVVDHDGPAAVLTLGRLRFTQAPRFFRTSAKAEGEVVDAPGLTWATGLARPPFVSTCSLWESSDALSAYAYGNHEQAHPAAIAADRAKPFHHQSAFIRFRPYKSEGHLDGKNPLAETWMSATT
ncbi:MAG: spheroidene monooxygenase [Actinomycetota bacterium]